MILLALVGVIFICTAVAVGVDVWQVNTGHVVVTAFDHVFSLPAWAVVGAGAVCGALIVVGLAMVGAAGARNQRLHSKRRLAGGDRVAAPAENKGTIALDERPADEQAALVRGPVDSDSVTRRGRRGAHFADRRSL